MKTKDALIHLLLVSSFILHPSSFLRADGGTVRLSEQKGGYQITVFTAPTPFRAGPVDISVLVQQVDTGVPITGAGVMVRAAPRGRPDQAESYLATTEAATNKLLKAAVFELSGSGWWEIEVAVEGPRGDAQVRFAVEAAEPLPRGLSLWAWIGWPAGAVLLFGIHQFLIRRRMHG
jgi:hypothetical protein